MDARTYRIKRTVKRIFKAPLSLCNLMKESFKPAAQIRRTLKRLEKIHSKYCSAEIYTSEKGLIVNPSNNPSLYYHPTRLQYLINGDYEPATRRFLLESLPKKGTFIDLGANEGFFSILLASKKDAKVYAFEPVKTTRDFLKKNIELNTTKDNVIVESFAVGNKHGYMNITTNHFGKNHISPSKNRNTQKTQITTMDAYIKKKNINKIDIIKADIEGAEILFLKGAKETLKNHNPYLVIEVSQKNLSRYGYTPQDVFRELESQGYRCIRGFRHSETKNCKQYMGQMNYLFQKKAKQNIRKS